MHYQINIAILRNKWDKVFKNESSKIWGRQSLKNLKGYGLFQACYPPSNVLKAWFHKFYLVHSWILCPKSVFKTETKSIPQKWANNFSWTRWALNRIFWAGNFLFLRFGPWEKKFKKKTKKIPYKDLREKYLDFIAYSENNRPAS